MRRSFPNFPKSLVFLLFPGVAAALEIRSYFPSRHDRFIDGVSGLEINSAAYYNPALYTAVGYATNTNDVRQFALVTPQHVLFAKHYAFGGNIRFLNTDGNTYDRTIGTLTTVPNESGGVTDLIIMKLSAPIGEAEKITPLPYLNLANENAYKNKVLTTFGQNRRAGRGVISSFSNFSQVGPPIIDSTRTFTFSHSVFTGNADDAVAISGDSGSPTFVSVNGKPALVGVHLAAGQGTFSNSTTDTFVPHYAETVNGILAPEGYQLIPAYPETVTLTSAPTNATLRQAFPGSIDIGLSNTNPNTATNVRMVLEFPPNAIPTTISGTGWIVENPSTGIYLLRTATLAGNTSSTVTASYSTIPVISEISINATHRSDGSPESSQDFNLPVQPTFAGFVSALPLKGELDDPDLDGFSNLIEYAFGGDPGASLPKATAGHSLIPIMLLENGSISFSFPRRTDAVARGLEYEIEFSETLEEISWGTTPPSGFSLSAEPYAPDSPGFEMVTATFPAITPNKQFLRVKATLTE